MNPTDRTQERTQKRGAYMALGVAGAFVLVIVYFVAFGGGNRGSSTSRAPADVGRPSREVAVPIGKGTGQMLGPAKGVRVDLTDKRDPNKRTGLLVFAAMDPLEGHRYSVERPEAWRFLDGGRTLYIRADSGQVFRPDGQKEPESGTIRGRVEIKLFEAGTDVLRGDPEASPALMVIRTESLTFEAAVGELATPDPFLVEWEGGKIEGDGLSLVLNQPQERLERGEIHRKGKLTLLGGAGKARAASTSRPASTPVEAAAPTPSTGSTPAATPIETIYRLVGNRQVVASQGGRRLTSDAFQVLARLIDNKLPEEAIRQVRFVRDQPSAGSLANPGLGAAPGDVRPAAAPGAPVAADPKASSDPLILTWDGPCVIMPLAAAPAELTKDHVAARFSANSDGRVILADSDAGVTGSAGAIEYAATSGSLALVGNETTSVTLASAASGRIETRRIDADLVTGLVRTPGPGTLASASVGGEAKTEQTLSWTDRGEFAFLVTDEGLTGRIKEATVAGGVKGDGRGLRFTSETASAFFATSAAGQLELSRVDLAGDAVAHSAETGSLSGQKIHVRLDPPSGSGNPRPRFVRAEDGFVVEREGQRLSGTYLESNLIDVAGGRVDVGTVLARGDVAFKSERDFIAGQTQELNADLGFDESGLRKQLVLLVGEGTTLSRDEPGRETGTISGTQLSIDGVRGRIEGFGAGNFTYRGLTGADDATIDASWMRRMVYDDAAGLLDLWGEARTKYSPDADTRNTVDADRIKLSITPGTPGRSVLSARVDSQSGSDAPREGERAVLGAEAYGSILDRQGGNNARIESRTYAAGELQKLSYLEGPSVLASNEKGTIRVPGAGKFLLVDQTAANRSITALPGVRDLGGDTRGMSLFEWATSLDAEKRASGETVMTMKDGVSVVHKALKDGLVTEIKCREIIATLKDRAVSLGEKGAGLELQSVAAAGSVYAASGPPRTEQQPRPPIRELIAHTLDYDAIARRIEARALSGGVVTMFEPSAASPTTASWLTWDLEKNSVQVRQPAGASPR